MRINSTCEACLRRREMKRAEEFTDESVRREYVKRFTRILEGRDTEDSSPYIGMLFNREFCSLGGRMKSFADINLEYDRFVLSMEPDVEAKIKASDDPLQTAFIYARLGNYIDFSALKGKVSKEEFLSLLADAEKEQAPAETWKNFLSDMEKCRTFLILLDNCGEIVLDKLFVRELKKRYPQAAFYAMVRGEEIGNDALMADAVFSGMADEAAVITNGLPAPGTIPALLPEESKKIFDAADVIVAKGQGNYESLNGLDKNIYYAFLCKCELFTERYGVPKFTGMFVK